jgi:uncharacterized protein YcfJ
MLKTIMASAVAASMAFGTVAVTTASEGAAASKRYCDRVARDYANRKAGAKQIGTGAAIGAGVGAAVGALVGDVSVAEGALVGGGLGLVGGGINANKKWRKYYERAYDDCRAN